MPDLSINSNLSEKFFENLVPLTKFADIVDSSKHTALPEDWFVIITDVTGSTKAIETGMYKAVNTVGACTIMAVKNVNRAIEIPYVFGGDGATLAIPPSMERGAREALLGAQELARKGFQLDLRIGIVPVEYLTARDMWVQLTKHRISENIVQAAITGRGWEYAEKIIKDPLTRDLFEVKETEDIKAKASFDGFECRWQGIKAIKDHKICILVQSMQSDTHEQIKAYNGIIEKIDSVYGQPFEHHPLREDKMKLAKSPKDFMGEALVQTLGKSKLAFVKYLGKIMFLNIIGTIIFWKKIDTKEVEWSVYQADLVQNSDYRKFDGMLKMVLDGSNEQQIEITKFFESAYKKKELAYGIHTAKEALLTCLIYSHQKKHAHFVDGSDGGYALAAKHLKERLLALKQSA